MAPNAMCTLCISGQFSEQAATECFGLDSCPAGSYCAPGATIVTPTILNQQISFAAIAASEYTAMSASYEMGYGKALNLVTCSGSSCTFEPGCTVTSSVDARRSTSVTFTTVVESSSTVTKPTAGVAAASLATGISTVISVDAGLTGTAPGAGDITVSVGVLSGGESVTSAAVRQCEKGTYAAIGATECVQCANLYSTASPGATSEGDCFMAPGYIALFILVAFAGCCAAFCASYKLHALGCCAALKSLLCFPFVGGWDEEDAERRIQVRIEMKEAEDKCAAQEAEASAPLQDLRACLQNPELSSLEKAITACQQYTVLQTHADMITALAAQDCLYALSVGDGAKLQKSLVTLRAAGITTLVEKADQLYATDQQRLTAAITSQQPTRLQAAISQCTRSMALNDPLLERAKAMKYAITFADETVDTSKVANLKSAIVFAKEAGLHPRVRKLEEVLALSEALVAATERGDVDDIADMAEQLKAIRAGYLHTLQQEGPLNLPGEWDYFYSHTQRSKTAVGLVEKLDKTMEIEHKKTGWVDVKMPLRSEAAMQEGVIKAKCVVSLVSGPCFDPENPSGPEEDNAYFNRSFCIKELEWAIDAGVPIQPVIDANDKKNIGEFLSMCPESTTSGKPMRSYLGGIDWIHVDRSDSDYWELGVKKILKNSTKLISESTSRS